MGCYKVYAFLQLSIKYYKGMIKTVKITYMLIAYKITLSSKLLILYSSLNIKLFCYYLYEYSSPTFFDDILLLF